MIHLSGSYECDAYSDQLNFEIRTMHIPWYLKPFSGYIRNIAKKFWCLALLERSIHK